MLLTSNRGFKLIFMFQNDYNFATSNIQFAYGFLLFLAQSPGGRVISCWLIPFIDKKGQHVCFSLSEKASPY